jgi:hypothetical protein
MPQSRPYQANLWYQADEEILQAYWYLAEFNESSDDPQNNCQAIAQLYIDRVPALVAPLNQQLVTLAVEVRAEAFENHGPARFIETKQVLNAGGAAARISGDSVIVNVNFEGERLNGATAVGGVRLSGVSHADYDSNVFSETFLGLMNTSIDNFFTTEILANARTFFQVIKSEQIEIAGGEPVLEYVKMTRLGVSAMVGSRIDRVGNRTARRSCAVAPPA